MNKSDKYKNSFEEGAKPNSGMKVPDGYFESFEKSILAKIIEESIEVEKPVVLLNSNRNYTKVVSFLAVAAAIIWALMVFTAPDDNGVPTSDFAEVETTDWEVYEVDEYALAENFTLEEMNEISFEEDYISNQDIYEYLLEEDYSEFLLLENL